MRTLKIRISGVIRYLRADGNPLRRPLDRAHARMVIALSALFLLLAPLVMTAVAHAVDHAGLRAEYRQAHTRHQTIATVITTSPGSARIGLQRSARIRWADAGGNLRDASVVAGKGDLAGTHRIVWVNQAGALTSPPRDHGRTVSDTTMAALSAFTGLVLLLVATYTLLDGRLERRRLALWEREWEAIAPRWTGRA